jgi:hypothetical protein
MKLGVTETGVSLVQAQTNAAAPAVSIRRTKVLIARLRRQAMNEKAQERKGDSVGRELTLAMF